MKQSRQENLAYLVVWSLLFVAPVLSLYVRTVSDTNMVFDWSEILVVWRKFTVYLTLFLIHNFLLAPLLVYKHKRITYFSLVAALLLVFTVYQCNSRPEEGRRPNRSKPPMEQPSGHEPPPFNESSMEYEHKRPSLPNDVPPRQDRRMPPKFHHPAPPPIVGERDILSIVILILMFGANLGIKGYFRGCDDRKRLAELEKENLEQQLEYLRYQINPHFFMNTLNNIHALIDLDPEKAQETVVELSKMMRFVLYEGDKKGVPLTKEIDFIRTYVYLMQLRYTEKVHIMLDLPTEVPDKTIPPLMLISFIENAFKHGVSYQHESFIEVKVTVEDESLSFFCRNSKVNKPNKEKGGVGLANVRKRLDLLFEDHYTLHINNENNAYTVELTIPLS